MRRFWVLLSFVALCATTLTVATAGSAGGHGATQATEATTPSHTAVLADHLRRGRSDARIGFRPALGFLSTALLVPSPSRRMPGRTARAAWFSWMAAIGGVRCCSALPRSSPNCDSACGAPERSTRSGPAPESEERGCHERVVDQRPVRQPTIPPSLPSRGPVPLLGKSRPGLADPPRDGALRIESLPGQDTVRRLQHVRGYPAVSLLMSTIPADRLTGADAATLWRLTAEAEHRVRDEAGGHVAAALAARLRLLGDQAARLRGDAGPRRIRPRPPRRDRAIADRGAGPGRRCRHLCHRRPRGGPPSRSPLSAAAPRPSQHEALRRKRPPTRGAHWHTVFR